MRLFQGSLVLNAMGKKCMVMVCRFLFLLCYMDETKTVKCFRFDAKKAKQASIAGGKKSKATQQQSNAYASNQDGSQERGGARARDHSINSTAAHPSQRNSISACYSRSCSSNSGDDGASDARDDVRGSGVQDPHTTISSSSTCARAAAPSGSSGVAAAAAVDDGVSSNRHHPTWSSA